MPIKCLNGDSPELAFEHDGESWLALADDNREHRHLAFECCDSRVVLRTSPRGTRYFAHLKNDGCTTAPETEEHILAKSAICQAIRRAGWIASPEHRLVDRDGAVCIADVFARRTADSHRGVVFEVQWSPQDIAVTRERTARYANHGARALWLMRQQDIPVSKDVPAVRITRVDDGFVVSWPGSSVADRRGFAYSKAIMLEEFVEGVLEGRFTHGTPKYETVKVAIHGGVRWCDECEETFETIEQVCFSLDDDYVGYGRVVIPALSLGDYSTPSVRELVDTINSKAEDHSCAVPITVTEDTFLWNCCEFCGKAAPELSEEQWSSGHSQSLDPPMFSFIANISPEELRRWGEIRGDWGYHIDRIRWTSDWV